MPERNDAATADRGPSPSGMWVANSGPSVPSMRTISLAVAKRVRGTAVVWAKAKQFQLDQSLGMLRVTVARVPTEEGTSTLVATVAPLRSKAEMAAPWSLAA